jgi:uncharacterized membrane protein (UPF0127 family)
MYAVVNQLFTIAAPLYKEGERFLYMAGSQQCPLQRWMKKRMLGIKIVFVSSRRKTKNADNGD